MPSIPNAGSPKHALIMTLDSLKIPKTRTDHSPPVPRTALVESKLLLLYHLVNFDTDITSPVVFSLLKPEWSFQKWCITSTWKYLSWTMDHGRISARILYMNQSL